MSLPFYSIRQARAGDLDAMVDLLRQLFILETDFAFDRNKQRHGLAALMADHERSLVNVAVIGDVVVGMCTAQITMSTAEGGLSALVEDMIVASHVRSRGVGNALLNAIAQWAKEHGCLRMQLLADKRNENALRFYHGNGWKLTNMICLTHSIPLTHHREGLHQRSRTISSGGTVYAT